MEKDFESGDRYDFYFQRKRSEIDIVACPWVGETKKWMHSVRDGEPDHTNYGPLMSGPIYRIRMDGSFYRVPKRTDEDYLGASSYDLFIYRL